jgi:malonate-semialdehyde dehydrogenase (acetylating)/methylmalonate-semialdehyde dehydrogenase
MDTIAHLLAGERRYDGDTHLDVFNPALGEVCAHVPVAPSTLIEEAVAVAREGARQWAATSLSKRSDVLFSFRALLVTHGEELAALITREHGKTLADARGEIARGLENVEYACGLVEHLKGEFSAQVSDGVDVHSFREPVGVVLAVTPFDFPAMVPLWMIASAIAAGNAVILKPSEKDPSAALFVVELLLRAGLPATVLTVLQGNGDTVGALLEHPGIDAVSFVGSTAVATSLHQRATASGKRCQALGGAKNHMVVLPDADLDAAADAVIGAAFGSAGERCMAVSVLVAVGSIADELVEKVAQRIDALRVGPGDDPSSDFGPLITGAHRDRVASYVQRATGEGQVVVRDGTAIVEQPGFFLGPCLLDHVQQGQAAYEDEIFGPVLTVVRVEHFDDAIELVRNHRYGNGVALFTRDGGAARRFTREVPVGMIGINVPIPVPVSSYSFGGWKDSLFGHTHIYGPEGFAFIPGPRS